ncbi:B12-binding domain-containing radical SAM protein [Desulfofustis glycolicus]|uniref:Radical SAM superfamily enzyme YgiQ, UPF0313 family n=1 Tax=Desulfofustis glycolicus DSM 9705 TaxID=1121409 RepID=A0A1M5UMI6_9BACT|nr:radical SAM protein [Desulfofustis glycolicus]MCB2217412.1 B12-binding domain-containing radical SAM protein [Desulfobulbaceae bacterium]SHH64130.1 Radical SAM superfamily enzyme YgiQ, UPF0313 family [Desulfofustis glycolicus DSM 9705]
MNILLVNPPNCGRSIPEERYGITSLKQIFRGEPLALEELAGNLPDHDVRILDLKVEPDGLDVELDDFRPEVIGLTGVTCEANTMLRLAREINKRCRATVVIGGIHASNDPQFFNDPAVDYIVTGLGRKRFADLIESLQHGPSTDDSLVPGVLRTTPGTRLIPQSRRATAKDLVVDRPPAYHLVSGYRSSYRLEKLGITMGFVATAFGCPHRCSFCCIQGQTGGSYLTKPVDAVLRDIRMLDAVPVIRFVDANTFGDIERAMTLGRALLESGIKKQYLADIRADTVVRYPELLRIWKDAGLRAVIIGFEEVADASLAAMQKSSQVQTNTEAIALLGELGITIVGDFIISPDYDEEDFERLTTYLATRSIDLPMITVLTPLPGTPLHRQLHSRITNHDLDYYTLTNAVMPTRLPEERFYTRYVQLLAASHHNARL